MRKLVIVLLCVSLSLSAMDDLEWEGFMDIVETIEDYGRDYTDRTTNWGQKYRMIYEVHHLMNHPFFQKGKFSLYLHPGEPPFLDFTLPNASQVETDEE